jgi:hypothetical protein
MKKLPKKLELHRETLRFLEDNRLENAHGGLTEYTCHNSCNSTPRSWCETCP